VYHYVLADNQEITRYAIHTLISDMGESEIEVVTTQKALHTVLSLNKSAIVVLDYALFDIVSVESLENIQQAYPGVSWLFFSENFTDDFLRHLVYVSHSSSFILKSASINEVKVAFSNIFAGERYISSIISEHLLYKTQKTSDHSLLTPTEIDILKEIAYGKTSKQIASERFCSIHTITTHRKNIYAKLDISTVYEATRYALRSGLIEMSDYNI